MIIIIIIIIIISTLDINYVTNGLTYSQSQDLHNIYQIPHYTTQKRIPHTQTPCLSPSLSLPLSLRFSVLLKILIPTSRSRQITVPYTISHHLLTFSDNDYIKQYTYKTLEHNIAFHN